MRFYQKIFQTYWNPYVAISLAGVLSALYFGATGTVWAVTGEFTRLGGHVLQWFGVDTSKWAYFNLIKMQGSPLTRTDGWIVIGMLIGALITVLLSNSFKIRVPQQKRRLLQGFVGGVIAGFGARLALGCNLAAFFSGVPQFSFHAWLFMLATAAGTYIGVKIVMTKWWRGKPNLKPVSQAQLQATPSGKKRSVQPWVGLIVILVFLAIVITFTIQGKHLLAVAALAGLGFGILIERGQICFTSAFRDQWISGRAVMTKAIAVGMIVATVCTFFYIHNGIPALIKPAAPSTLLGGLLFGIGIVMAGGCETGMMYRMMEGQVLYIFVGLGNLVGATLLAFAWDHLGFYNTLVQGWQPINLLKSWGETVGLLGTLAMLGLWWLSAHWWSRHYKFGRGLQVKSDAFVARPMKE
ncbi:selenium metabolism membrane protein YedE/FdhT [Tumebacillus sp. ITR2]|uniref:Selenium metabolism membrane protein YedE/FdhT n=1 Tax=Tumebacillus amylolyticus TaxID=2801339 RepID=A0ABS1J4G7_9BACL|nr:selenium metabolism membrane protein YedE/FdhT [Tumebacillus amylolyticus]MBL0385169.1 selenium metabolism membrane protein YedE/FdhT [Tumebacillus amylolyticus]